jgi:3-phenylpropionate/trans-cinnamate dioxygenase ferredoxin reductase subunit
VRLESVQNAVDQAKFVAEVIQGDTREYGAVPWFWSQQYDDKLQTVGLLAGHDEVIVRGDPTSSAKFSVVYLQDAHLVAVDAVNNVRDFAQAKALLGRSARGTRAELADVSRPLRELFAAAT